MKHVCIPTDYSRTPAFYLAAEEYVARKWPGEPELWFTWRVDKCVVMGRNQVVENEINLDFCRRNGIGVFRRKSGGGCVYADLGNIMMSYVAEGASVGYTFSKYIGLVVLLLQKLGVPATASGRNDVLVDGRKVSGSAFLHLPTRNIAHGTLLYDTQMENMLGALTPTSAKLDAKGVKSVRSRVGLLKDYVDIGQDELEQHLISGLCRGEELVLDEDDVRQIERRAQEYLSPGFLYGSRQTATRMVQKRIEGVGEMRLDLVMRGEVIEDVWVSGDFFCTGRPVDDLISPLRGVRPEEVELRRALRDLETEGIVMGLKKDDFIDLIIG